MRKKSTVVSRMPKIQLSRNIGVPGILIFIKQLNSNQGALKDCILILQVLDFTIRITKEKKRKEARYFKSILKYMYIAKDVSAHFISQNKHCCTPFIEEIFNARVTLQSETGNSSN
jgi:hypothetical protein